MTVEINATDLFEPYDYEDEDEPPSMYVYSQLSIYLKVSSYMKEYCLNAFPLFLYYITHVLNYCYLIIKYFLGPGNSYLVISVV